MSDTVDTVVPDSAEQPVKQLRGRPITKENAKAMALSAAKAKRQRKQARLEMLNAMCTQLSLGDELVAAIKHNDDVKIAIVEKALRIVGLTHDQSEQAIAQKMEIKSDAHVKKDSTVKLVIEDFTKPEES